MLCCVICEVCAVQVHYPYWIVGGYSLGANITGLCPLHLTRGKQPLGQIKVDFFHKSISNEGLTRKWSIRGLYMTCLT